MRRLVLLLFAVLLGSAFLLTPRETSAYARCNCTAWASAKRPDLPLTLGNAKTWAYRAKMAGFPVDGNPRVGDIIALQPGVQGADRRYGHVAYVVAVKGSRVYVTEMNGGGGCRVISDTFRVGRGVLFIHPKKG